MSDPSDNKKAQAEKAFKRDEAARDGSKAMAEHRAEGLAVRANMDKLREQRLAREAELAAKPPAKPTKSMAAPKGRRSKGTPAA